MSQLWAPIQSNSLACGCAHWKGNCTSSGFTSFHHDAERRQLWSSARTNTSSSYLQGGKHHHFLFCTLNFLQKDSPLGLLIELVYSDGIVLCECKRGLNIQDNTRSAEELKGWMLSRKKKRKTIILVFFLKLAWASSTTYSQVTSGWNCATLSVGCTLGLRSKKLWYLNLNSSTSFSFTSCSMRDLDESNHLYRQ